MITLAQIAKKNNVSKSYVRKLYNQGRLTSGDKIILKPGLGAHRASDEIGYRPHALRAGNVLLFPDDTRIPASRAPYGSLKKIKRVRRHTPRRDKK